MKWTYFLTLTLPAENDGQPTVENVKFLNQCWRRFLRWLRKKVNVSNFAWCNELGERTNRLHKHALISCRYLNYSRARRAVVAAGFGAVCDFQKVRTPRGILSYVSKYMSLALRTCWPKYSRRCQTSVPALVAESKGSWLFEKLKLPERISKRSEEKMKRLEENWQHASSVVSEMMVYQDPFRPMPTLTQDILFRCVETEPSLDSLKRKSAPKEQPPTQGNLYGDSKKPP